MADESGGAVGTGAPALDTAVLDIDGVVADVRHRLAHLQRRPKDWDAFFAAASDDAPLPEGVALAQELAARHRIVWLTGRPERIRNVTANWLKLYGLPTGEVLMRPARDFRPARVYKLAVLRRLSAASTVTAFVDDDPEVVAAARGAGFAAILADWAPPTRDLGALRAAQDKDGRT